MRRALVISLFLAFIAAADNAPVASGGAYIIRPTAALGFTPETNNSVSVLANSICQYRTY